MFMCLSLQWPKMIFKNSSDMMFKGPCISGTIYNELKFIYIQSAENSDVSQYFCKSLELLFDCRSFSKQLWVSVQVQNRV